MGFYVKICHSEVDLLDIKSLYRCILLDVCANFLSRLRKEFLSYGIKMCFVMYSDL